MNKLNKKELLSAFKADLKAAETLKTEWDTRRENWISESAGSPYGNEEKGKSSIVSKDIKKQLDWMLPSLTDPFLSTPDVIKCNPVTWEDTKSARQNQLLLNSQFCRKFNRYNFIMKATRVLSTEGTVVIQTGWDYEDTEVESEVEVIVMNEYGEQEIQLAKVTETKVTKNQPTAKVCRNEDIYIDPTCMDVMENCQFVIHRYETDLSSLRSDGRYKNLDKVAKLQSGEDYDFDPEDETDFIFKDTARKKLVVHEYWGNYDVDGDGEVEAIVCAWVGDTIIRLESNPYPDEKPPFIIVPFNAIPFQMFGEALAENIGDNQKVKTALTRGIIDNASMSNNAMVGIRKGALDVTNRKKFLAKKNFEFNGTPNDFWQGSYNQIPSSVFDMLAMMNNEIESQTGVKSFSGGITGNALGSTATSARGALDATATRRLNLVRNLAENMLKPLFRKWMAYNAEFLEESEVVRLTNESFEEVRKDDLDGRIDIDLAISTAEDNAAKADTLSFMMQTTAQSMDPDMKFELMGDWADLSRMPEEAKKLRDKAEQVRQQMGKPTPQQEIEMERQRLENELLKAQIEAAKASSQEDMADKLEKIAQAEYKKAQTRKLNSETALVDSKKDLQDMQFIKEDEDIAHRNEMEKKEFDRQTTLGSMAFQAKYGGKNEQLGVR